MRIEYFRVGRESEDVKGMERSVLLPVGTVRAEDVGPVDCLAELCGIEYL